MARGGGRTTRAASCRMRFGNEDGGRVERTSGRPRSEAAVFVDVAGKFRVPNALRRHGADLAATPVPVLRGRAEGRRGAARGGRENVDGGVRCGAPASEGEGG